MRNYFDEIIHKAASFSGMVMMSWINSGQLMDNMEIDARIACMIDAGVMEPYIIRKPYIEFAKQGEAK
jgi:hypothetical protein